LLIYLKGVLSPKEPELMAKPPQEPETIVQPQEPETVAEKPLEETSPVTPPDDTYISVKSMAEEIKNRSE